MPHCTRDRRFRRPEDLRDDDAGAVMFPVEHCRLVLGHGAQDFPCCSIDLAHRGLQVAMDVGVSRTPTEWTDRRGSSLK